ncbi:family 10 glycosylhydrolase [candidate division WOR-3 bacterium]|nr:family 10 glycosylhydrolase [candidate division WOR-3 bacterium]
MRIFIFLFLTASQYVPQEGKIKAVWLPGDFLHEVHESSDFFNTSENLNTVILQVVKNGKAYYPSTVIPTHENMDYDHLDLAIAEFKARGFKVYLWMNTLLAYSGYTLPDDPGHVLDLHPEWSVLDLANFRTNNALIPLDSLLEEGYEGIYLDPSNPQVVSFAVSIARELVSNYNADGIIFDFVRYPSEDFPANFFVTSAEMDIQDLFESSPQEPSVLLNQWQAYRYVSGNSSRIENIDSIIFSLVKTVKNLKPDMVTAATSFPDVNQTSLSLGQNWLHWNTDFIFLFVDSFSNDTVFLFEGKNVVLVSKSFISGAEERTSGTVRLLPGTQYSEVSDLSNILQVDFITSSTCHESPEFNLPFPIEIDENCLSAFRRIDEKYYSILDSLNSAEISFKENLLFTAIFREDADIFQIKEAFRFLQNGANPEEVCYMFNSGQSPFLNCPDNKVVCLSDTNPPFFFPGDEKSHITPDGRIGFFAHSVELSDETKFFWELDKEEKRKVIFWSLLREIENNREFDNSTQRE